MQTQGSAENTAGWIRNDIIEARLLIRDCEVDIARLAELRAAKEKDPKQRWGSADESMVVIRFANPIGVDFPYLLRMLNGAFMSRPNTVVIPGGSAR